MGRKPETRLVHKILEGLNKAFPGSYFRKIHGNPYQHAGIPDLVGCVEGFFIGLEVKTDEGGISTIQVLEGIAIGRAGGAHSVVTSPEEAVKFVSHAVNSMTVNIQA